MKKKKGNEMYVITISYGNYKLGVGGTDKVIYTQQKLLNQRGIGMMHLCFNYGLGKLNLNTWNVYWDGNFIGYFSTERLLAYINQLYNNGKSLCNLFIHHLKGMNVSELIKVLDYCKVPIVYYLHDYYTICPSAGLIKENGEFCGCEVPNGKKCKNCSYYKETSELLPQIKLVLSKYENRLTYIIPSDAAKKIWCGVYPQYEKQVKVIYHQKLQGIYKGNNEIIENDESLKIAFVGYQKPLKGWKQWKKAIEKAQNEKNNISFFQFGWGNDKINYCKQVNVDFKDDLFAMTNALRDNKIHCAVIWSLWPETYAYTYYESLAANTFVITNMKSGNVCAQVLKRKNGMVVEDLGDLLCNEKTLRNKVNEFRTSQHTTPLILAENTEFLKLISDVNWIPEMKRGTIDYSWVLTVVKKWMMKIKNNEMFE